MKNKLLIVLSLIIICLSLITGCASNNSSLDKSIFTKARIDQSTAKYWEVNVKSWEKYGDQIQIETDSGLIILVDKSRVILTNQSY